VQRGVIDNEVMQCGVIVNGEQREIASRNVDALLGELEYEGTHFAIALNYDVLAAQPMGADADQERRRRSRSSRPRAGRVR